MTLSHSANSPFSDVCPMVFVGRPISAELSRCILGRSGTASWIFGRRFRPAAPSPAGRFWNRLGRGSFDHVRA